MRPAFASSPRAAAVLSRPRAVAAAVLLAGAALGAGARTGAARTARPPVAPARIVTVTARDYAFEMPDTIAAGRTEVRLVNRGPELHHVQLVRLAAGHTPAEFFAAMRAMKPGAAPPAWVRQVGGPNSPAPGGTSAAVLVLAPGTHVLVCFIPSPDGTPHVMKGMSRVVTVVPAPAVRTVMPAGRVRGAAEARSAIGAPDVTMTLTDYGFALSAPLTRGARVVRVRNTAAQPHEVFVVRLAPGKTAQDALAWVEKMQGPPPMQPLGGTSGMDTGEFNDVALDLAPGEYALLCFIPDARDGRPHVAHGMVRQITVR
jgi:plastocyanin